ncbi:hypothetical protein [Sphingomonas sp.]|uniref:hypothetical protein n=1 Tax=Sphingomonas sp. TaxID=28214 RepID=UPI0025E9CB4A|nr:hypothetical protein [Sphingomonas sp.]
MRSTIALVAILLIVRAESVEARDQSGSPTTRPSTSSGRTGEPTPIDAERAFAADAKTLGQWTAFRKWSTDDAVMFVPQPVNAHGFLKDRKDPPKAIDWWPTASYISCDGKVAVNTGGWKRPDGAVGYFSTVWVRQPDGGWKWVVDGGDGLKDARPIPSRIKVQVASCKNTKKAYYEGLFFEGEDGGGASPDHTISWYWRVSPDGSRVFEARLWNGKKRNSVIGDAITGSPANK